ncbi:MAG: hypothetical protein M0Z53_16440 [Thermaerobacter sp.]|nr:hypothetical protein [Thermaerobacter sp.]
MRAWLRRVGWLPVLVVGSGILSGCASNPDAIGNMPGPVQQVVNTATLSGDSIGQAMLIVTGNQSYLGTGNIPGTYSYGPADDASNNAFYVNFNVPTNLSGIRQALGYTPRMLPSVAYPTTVYIHVQPLPNESFDRLYYDPSTRLATFSFKLNANGSIMDESWNAVLVNS